MEKLNNNRIKQVRLEQKKKQKEVASFLGITEQALSYYERGKREPKLETWQKLADYFGVSVGYLQGISSDTQLDKLNEFFDPLIYAIDLYKNIVTKPDTEKTTVDLSNRDLKMLELGFSLCETLVKRYKKFMFTVDGDLTDKGIQEIYDKVISSVAVTIDINDLSTTDTSNNDPDAKD